MNLSQKDLTRLEGLHIDLVRVVRKAAELMPDDLGFQILEGVRTQKRQAELVAKGASQTMKSRHLTGHAVDLGVTLGEGLAVRWDWPLYHRLAPFVKQAADECIITIEWGGDWRSFPDGPHWQLPWLEYPA
jgi:peptidoglycan L-alanyl-D-glutamate endopeptidase CwlK